MECDSRDLVEPWDVNAKLRHEQLLSGKDVSFSRILIPATLDLLKSMGGVSSSCLLDIGCGTGIFANAMAKYVGSVMGIDPSCVSISIAREYNRGVEKISFECTSIEKYSLTNHNSCDIAVANMSFHTISDLENALLGVSRCLRSRGSLIFSIPHPCFYLEHRELVDMSDYQYNYQSFHDIPFVISHFQAPLPRSTPYFHRPIEDYAVSLHNAGFCINYIKEPFPNKEIMKLYPVEKEWEYPHFVLFLCSKAISRTVRGGTG